MTDKDEMKNKISMALKDPILQQGFEIICKNLTELEAQIEKMKCCEICAKSKDWRNRSLCVECEKSKSHINFELRR